MSWQRLSYAVFIAALLVMVAAVAIRMRSDAPRDAGLVAQLVSPGPLSSAHQSFAGQCTACHTPGSGKVLSARKPLVGSGYRDGTSPKHQFLRCVS